MIRRFFNSQTKTVTFAAGLLSISALASRFLGLIRDGLLAGYFGAGTETDIYFAAFRVPDFVYNFLIVGGLSIAFLPLFAEYYSRNKEEAWKITNNLLNVFSLLIIFLSAVLFIFTPWLIDLITPGFSLEEKELTSALTRLMFLSPIFFGISNIFSSILHYFNRFLVYSVAPVLYNLGIIFGIVFLVPRYGIFGVGIGVIIGALAHLLIQIPSAVGCGFRYNPIFNIKHSSLREVIRLMLPRSFAVGVQQINLIVITSIASTLFAGSIAIFNFSNNLQYVPVGIFGISFAVASFPKLSKTWAQGNKEDFLNDFSSIFRQIMFLVIPASILMFLLRTQLVRVVLGSLGPGKFDWQDTILTATSLGIFSIGIFASALIPLICRAFFSFKDTKTPTLIAVISVGLNILLSFYLVSVLENPGFVYNSIVRIFDLDGVKNISVLGLPLAFTKAVVFQFILLIIFFHKKVGGFGVKKIAFSLWKIMIAVLLMFASVYFSISLTGGILDTKTFLGVFAQGIISGLVGIVVYLITSIVFKIPEIKIIKSAVLKQFSK